jgi:hypothetical protein
MPPTARRSPPFMLVGVLWLAAAIVLGGSGQLLLLKPPVPQLVVAGLTAALIAAGIISQVFRHWLAGLRLRQVVALHITRFVGAYFLVLYARGELPYLFAVPGGWGDMVVATGALMLVLLVPALEANPRWLLLWNLVGLVDILFVVFAATKLALADPASMSALLHLPLSLLPTFLVPLIIASHVLIFWRLGRATS